MIKIYTLKVILTTEEDEKRVFVLCFQELVVTTTWPSETKQTKTMTPTTTTVMGGILIHNVCVCVEVIILTGSKNSVFNDADQYFKLNEDTWIVDNPLQSQKQRPCVQFWKVFFKINNFVIDFQ